MKKFLACVFLIGAAHVSNQALAACGTIDQVGVLGAKGSPLTVKGNPVALVFSSDPNMAFYIDNVLSGYIAPDGLLTPANVNLSPGTHSAAVGTCTVQFDVVAIPSGQQPIYQFDWWQNNDVFNVLDYYEAYTWATYNGIAFTTFVSPIDGDMTELHRCWYPWATEHFVSNSSNCEGLTYEGSYGYVSTIPRTGFVQLNRYWNSSKRDHITKTGSAPSGYVFEGTQGYVPE